MSTNKIEIIFANNLKPEIYEMFIIEKFNMALILIPPESRMAAVEKLADDGFVIPKRQTSASLSK